MYFVIYEVKTITINFIGYTPLVQQKPDIAQQVPFQKNDMAKIS